MYYKIKVGSITNAQRANKLLHMHGYRSTITRLENPSHSDGCGFVIEVHDTRDTAVDLLKKYGIRILGVEYQ